MDESLLVGQGTFLAAGPDMLDPNFMHAVVLICQHSNEGAYGLIVNRPTGQTSETVLAEHPLLREQSVPIFQGGPVGLDTLQIVHRVAEHVPGGVELIDNIWIGGNLTDVASYVEEAPAEAARNVRLFLGYAGWSPGQLELELALGSWLPAPSHADCIFSADTDSVWRDVVGSIGGPGAGLENQPPDPSWN